MTNLRPPADRGNHLYPPIEYGRSVLGNRLEYWPAISSTERLIVAGFHGEEADTTVVLSKALCMLNSPPALTAVVPAANPDGILRGMRGNANGIDLNRNFPTLDWRPGTVLHTWTMDGEQEVKLNTGAGPASEPETKALLELLKRLKPKQIIALHGPLACIDDPSKSELAQRLAERTGFPLVADVGYPTPGSFGTWAAEQKIPLITWEFAPDSIEKMFHTTVPILVELLTGELG